MKSYIEQILNENKLAYAIFDQDLFLNLYSANFNKILYIDNLSLNSTIWEVFPELFGSEDQVQAVLYSKQKRFQIEKINKFTDSGGLFYYNLTLLPLKDKTIQSPRLLCIIADTTTETSLEQKIQQQKYEIEILKATLSSYGNYMSGGILGTYLYSLD